MKIKIKTIAWNYPASKEDVVPEIWDLDLLRADKRDPRTAVPANPFWVLLMLLGQGGILELSVTCDSEQTVDFIRDIFFHSGGSYSVTSEEAKNIWLYHPEYECYLCANGNYREYYFLNPVSDPDL